MTDAGVVRSLDFLASSPEFVELRPGPGLAIDLRYASANNFVGRDMYGPFRRAYLHRIAADKLTVALTALRAEHPDHGFLVFDALRPRSVQRVLWSHVVGTPGQSYIANPDRGSLHNYGFAVDLTVTGPAGAELDMGAGYDDFRPIAEPRNEERFLASGELTGLQWRNRMILRRAMEAAGFTQLAHEWWHFDALDRATVQARHQLVE